MKRTSKEHFIRRARLADLDALVKLEQSCFGSGPYRDHQFSRTQYRRYLRNEQTVCLVAELQGAIVGVALAVLATGAREGSARLLNLAVARSARRSGLGGRLLASAIRELRHRGCERLRLEVADTAPAAARLFEETGFRKVRLLPHYYGENLHATRLQLPIDLAS